jgi:hypothetical protein
MDTYVFSGVVLPERVSAEISGIPPLTFEVVEQHFQAELIFSIHASQISAQVKVIKGKPEIASLRNIIDSIIRSVVDFFAYTQGYAYDLEITSVTDQVGKQVVFGVDIPSIHNDKEKRPFALHDFLNARSITKCNT